MGACICVQDSSQDLVHVHMGKAAGLMERPPKGRATNRVEVCSSVMDTLLLQPTSMGILIQSFWLEGAGGRQLWAYRLICANCLRLFPGREVAFRIRTSPSDLPEIKRSSSALLYRL